MRHEKSVEIFRISVLGVREGRQAANYLVTLLLPPFFPRPLASVPVCLASGAVSPCLEQAH